MTNQLLILISALVFLGSLSQGVNAQTSLCSNYILKVIYFEGRPISYQRISPEGESGNASDYSLFKMIPKWQQPAGTPRVRAVGITPSCADEKIMVSVSVVKGPLREREMVGKYSITDNAKIRLTDLARYGIEPFELSIIPTSESKSAR